MDITPDNIIVNSCEYTPVYLIPNPSVTQAGSYIISQRNQDVTQPVVDNLKSFYESSGNLENGILSSPKKPRILRKQSPSVIGNNLKLASFLLPKTEIPVIKKEFIKKEIIEKEYYPQATQPIVFKPVVTTFNTNVVNTLPRMEVESKIVKIGALPLKKTISGRSLPKSKPRDIMTPHQVITNPNPSKHTSVQLLKLGETYHSLNQLSDDQMKIVNKALNLFSDPENIPKEPAYDPVTNTKFIYKVVSPRDLTVVGKNNVEIKQNNIKKKIVKKVEKNEIELECSPTEPTVTRSGRTVKTPKPMCEEIPSKPRKKSGSVINCFQCSSEFCSLYRLQRHYEIYPTHIPARIHSNLFHCLLAIMQSGPGEDQANIFIQQLEHFIEKLKTLLPCLLKKIDGREGKLCNINDDIGRLFGMSSGKYNLNMDAINCVKDKDGYCVHNPPPKHNQFSTDMSKPSQLWLSKHNEEIANNEVDTEDCARINSVDKWPTTTKRNWKLKQQRTQKSKSKRMRLASESSEPIIELGMDDVVTFSKPDGDIVTYVRPDDDVVRFSKPANDVVTFSKPDGDIVTYIRPDDDVVRFSTPANDVVTFSKPDGDIVTYIRPDDNVVRFSKTANDVVTFSKSSDDIVSFSKSGNDIVSFSKCGDDIVSFSKSGDDIVSFDKSDDDIVTFIRPNDDVVMFSKPANGVDTFNKPDEESAIDVGQNSVSLLEDNDDASKESTEQPVIKKSSTSTEFYSAHFDIRSSPIKPSALVRKFQIDPKKFTSYDVQVMRPLVDKPNETENEIVHSDSENLQFFRNNDVHKSTVINTDLNFGNEKGWTVSSDEQSNDSFMKSSIFESGLTPVKENNSIEPSLIHMNNKPNNLFEASRANHVIEPKIPTKSNSLIEPSFLKDGSNGFFIPSSRSDSLIASTLTQTKSNSLVEQSLLNSKDGSNDFFVSSSRSDTLIAPTLLQTKSSSLTDASLLNSKDGSNGFFDQSLRSDNLIKSNLVQNKSNSMIEQSLLHLKDQSNGLFEPAPICVKAKPTLIESPFNYLKDKSSSLFETALSNVKERSNNLFEPTSMHNNNKNSLIGPSLIHAREENGFYEAVTHRKHDILFEQTLLHENDKTTVNIDESHSDHLSTSNQGQSVLNFLESLGNELSYPETEIRNNSVDFQLDLFSFNSS